MSVRSVGSGLAVALALVLVLGAGIGVLCAWSGAGAFGRIVLVLVLAGVGGFAAVVLTYEGTSLLDHRDRYRYARDMRSLAVYRAENGQVLAPRPDLPRIVPVAGGRLLYDGGDGNGDGVAVIDQILDAADQVGLSRRALEARGLSRSDYDWGITALEDLGLLVGRSERTTGRLVTSPDIARGLVRRALAGENMSTFDLARPGDVGPPQTRPDQAGAWWRISARG